MINFQHLYYFWQVAKEGNLTRTSKKLYIAQSAISIQIKKLEERLGQELFKREGRVLILTEAGKVALEYADEIFKIGGELSKVLEGSTDEAYTKIKIGAVATLSRNFQEAFIKPLLLRNDTKLFIRSGQLDELVSDLEKHNLDIILSNTPISSEKVPSLKCKRIAQQKISVIGKKKFTNSYVFPEIINQHPIVLPTKKSEIRTLFDTYCDTHNLNPTIVAEADDMATLRLIVRDTEYLAILPKVVVLDEIKSKMLFEYGVIPKIYESFYAIFLDRKYQKKIVKDLIKSKVNIS